MSGARLRTVDAFTDIPFTGNPAAVLVLDRMPSDAWMLAIAREVNVPDTAFVIDESPPEADFRLRWFTPSVEVDLCGHATLASAHCLFEDGFEGAIRFATRSGTLSVSRRDDGRIAMDFPMSPPVEVESKGAVAEALDVPLVWTGRADMNGFLLAVLQDEGTVRSLDPNMDAIAGLDSPLIVTASADAGRPYDFVSRVFAPTLGIPEDPVTGSSHTVLAPYWARRTGRTSLVGFQVSERTGVVGVEVRDDRVVVLGSAVTVFDGSLKIDLTR